MESTNDPAALYSTLATNQEPVDENRIEHRSGHLTKKEKAQMFTSKRVEGEVEYNNGQFAEVITIGIEGIEEGLLLHTIQIHRSDTDDTPEAFQRRFPVGMRLKILTSTAISAV